MAITLEHNFNSKQNSFGFLRLILASVVVFSHSYFFVSPTYEPLASMSSDTATFGTLAVSIFFTVSGFLITRSYVMGSSLLHFLRNRFLRIYPAFWICLLMTIFVFAPIASYITTNNFSLTNQNFSFSHLSYFINNFSLKIHQHTISNGPTVLVSNNSLWTLYYEGLCYVGIAVLGYLGILTKRRYVITTILILLTGLLCIGHFFPQFHVLPLFAPWKMTLFRVSSCFFAGATLYLYADKIQYSPKIAIIMALLYCVTIPMGITEITDSLLLSYPVLLAGFSPMFAWTDKYGDFSYGTYLYAFPVQTLLHHGNIHSYGVFPFFLLSLGITLVIAIASYHWVEKPCLTFKTQKQKHRSP